MPKLNALVPYYGCKRQAMPRISQAIGEHEVFWDVACGSLAPLLALEPCRQEVVNDLHGGVINLARVVQSDSLAPDLFDRLLRTAFCEDLYANACEYLWQRTQEGFQEAMPCLEWAYSYFVASWMGRNGLVGTTSELNNGFCKRFTSNGGDPATRFRNAAANIPVWWQRLRRVTILCECMFGLLARIEDKAGTVIYVDPPYLNKQAKYVHDFGSADHQRLADALRRFKKTKVVVSYYAHELLASLYPGWQVIDIATQKNLTTTAVKAPEVLLVNLGE